MMRFWYAVRGLANSREFPTLTGLPTLRQAVAIARFYPGVYGDGAATHVVRMLREDCSPVPSGLPACRTLAPGQSVNVQPWTGCICNAKCPIGCHGEGFAQPGETFRIVVKSCDSDQSWFSKPMRRQQ
jgi:hypothetical protein